MAQADDFDLNAFLKAFRNNPTEVLNALPYKSKDASITHNLEDKFKVRKQLTFSPSKSVILSNDTAQVLLGGGFIEFNLLNMDTQNLKKSKPLKNAPWSDDYWPIYKGVLGNRYADDQFNKLFAWDKAFNYVERNSMNDILERNNDEEIDTLSPSEKYDHLLGLKSNGLTRSMWLEGKKYFENSGNVETWMGICHGWAPASYMVDRPTKKIQVKSVEGRDITFYPSDIKALASLLWAKSSANINFIGGRCNSKDPRRDSNGRVTEPDCLDTNPGTWHVSVVNQLGIRKQSFVFDATFDYEVWNQPVVAYNYKYFNPNGERSVNTLEEAIIPLSEFKNDPFKKYRARNATYVVGIQMEVKYLVETPPSQRHEDHPGHDGHNSVYYVYDLELDANYNIVGGEWYQNAHPDFLWTPEKDARALSDGDFFILGDDHWNGKEKMSRDWVRAASQSARFGSPLAMIVESLIKISNNQGE